MDQQSSLDRYRLLVLISGVFIVILFVVMLLIARVQAHDKRTYDRAVDVSTKLDNYITDRNTIPSSLEKAGISSVPSAINYRKVSDTRYEFCVKYQAASGSNPLTALDNAYYNYGGVVTPDAGGIDAMDQTVVPGLNLGGYVDLDSPHHRGQNCQTVAPYLDTTTPPFQSIVQPFTQNSDGSYTVCGVKTDYYEGDERLTRSVSAADTIVAGVSTTTPYPGMPSFTISPGSKIFDEQCHEIPKTDLTAGTAVSPFDIVSGNAPAVTIFLKRSY